MSVIPFPQQRPTETTGGVRRIIKLLKERLARPHPDWLRSARSFRDLPRVEPGPFPHIVPVPLISADGIVTRIIFILNSGGAAWTFTQHGFSFESERDAKAFRAEFPEQGELLTFPGDRVKRASCS